MKLKILYISVRADYGGGTKHLDQLISNLYQTYEIYCASPIEKPFGVEWKKRLTENKFVELPHRKFSLSAFNNVRKLIKNEKIRIIHAHGKGGALYGRLLKIFFPKVKVVFTMNGFHIDRYSKITKPLFIFYERMLSKLTDIFITVSKGEQELCIKNKIYSKEKSILIYNAIENKNDLILDKSELRERLSIDQNKFVIITLTRFDYQKNMMESLLIAQKLLKDKSIIFIWIGDGQEKQIIEEQLNIKKINNVIMTGYQQNTFDYLYASDLYLSTARWEGMPYSLIEACSAGIPIVASNVVGNNEAVLNGFNGYVFNLNEVDTAVSLIKSLKQNLIERSKFAMNSIKLFENNFQINKMIEKTIQVYQNLY